MGVSWRRREEGIGSWERGWGAGSHLAAVGAEVAHAHLERVARGVVAAGRLCLLARGLDLLVELRHLGLQSELHLLKRGRGAADAEGAVTEFLVGLGLVEGGEQEETCNGQ